MVQQVLLKLTNKDVVPENKIIGNRKLLQEERDNNIELEELMRIVTGQNQQGTTD